jgi:hypothetical protein
MLMNLANQISSLAAGLIAVGSDPRAADGGRQDRAALSVYPARRIPPAPPVEPASQLQPYMPAPMTTARWTGRIMPVFRVPQVPGARQVGTSEVPGVCAMTNLVGPVGLEPTLSGT